MCYVYAYADGRGVSVNMFATRAERDIAVCDLLKTDFEDTDAEIPWGTGATAQQMWDAYVEASAGPDFYLAFGEL